MHRGETAFHEQPAWWDVNPGPGNSHAHAPPRAQEATEIAQTNQHQASDRQPSHQERHIRKVLVATDFSPLSVKAVAQAAALANQFNATLTILHVIDINAQAEPGRCGRAAELMKYLWEESITKMGQMAWSLSERVNAQTAVKEGLPWEEIVHKSREADLLVVGKSRAKSLAKLFSQRTAQRVIENSACPVLVVRETD